MATSGKSTYLSNSVLNYILRTTAFATPPPATFYLALFTGGSWTGNSYTLGTELVVGSSPGYARQSIVAATIFNAAASAGSIQNAGGAITFAAATGSWQQVTGWALYDAVTAGNQWYWGPLQGTNDVQTVSTTAQLTAGTYTLNPLGTTSVAINFNDTAAVILEKLEAALGTSGGITVAFSGNQFNQATPGTLVITFVNQYGSAAQTLQTLTPSGITGGTLSIAHTTTGASGAKTLGVNDTFSIPTNNLTVTEQ